MSDHSKRMAEVAFWAAPRPGTAERDRLERFIQLHREEPGHQKLLRETFLAATALLQIQSKNGAGLPADMQLREYNTEYNGRILRGSLHDLPSSFNVAEAFNKFIPRTATFKIRTENDHLFSFPDFIDWVTSNSADSSLEDISDLLSEGIIHSYNSFSRPSDLLFKAQDSNEYGVAALSLIRHGHEISMMMLAGQKCDLGEQTIKLNHRDVGEPAPHRAHIKPDPERAMRAEPLSEDSCLWKTVVLVRFDNSTKTIDARYVFRDCGNRYIGHTDDVTAYLGEDGLFFSKNFEEHFKATSERMKDYETLFELCKTCLLLPKYFNSRDDDIQIERHATSFKQFKAELKNKRLVEKVDPAQWITHREVRKLIESDTIFPSVTTFAAPDYRVETSGYWKRLPLDVEGADKHGRPIQGRTWVSQVNSWVELPSKPMSATASNAAIGATGRNPGFIYVMRSAAHAKNVFKVGLTRRSSDERSRELSSNTSAPDHFLLAEDWATPDCVQAERLIHLELDQYRMNPRREFFVAPYRTIREVVERVIRSQEIDGRSRE